MKVLGGTSIGNVCLYVGINLLVGIIMFNIMIVSFIAFSINISENQEVLKSEIEKTNVVGASVESTQQSNGQYENLEVSDLNEVPLINEASFTEDIIGFDVNNYMNTIFDNTESVQSFLSEYAFEIVEGDIGGFVAEDELKTRLTMGLVERNGGFMVDYFYAEISSYQIRLDEVKKICDPYNEKELQYNTEDLIYYYSLFVDNVEVRYCYSHDTLRAENPNVDYITISTE